MQACRYNIETKMGIWDTNDEADANTDGEAVFSMGQSGTLESGKIPTFAGCCENWRQWL